MVAIGTTNVCAEGTQTQTESDEVEALRKEVKELRKLVDLLLESQGLDGANRVGASRSGVGPTAVTPRSDDASNQENEPRSKTEVPIDLFSARQPLGRFPDDAFVTAGEFDRSISVPGTSGSFRVGGAVQLNANYDPDNQGFQFIGTPPTIPVDGDVDDGSDQFLIHPRHSRVNFDFRAPTRLGQFRTFVEFDFFGDGNEFTNDFDLRLRHAAAELGPWKIGQFWSGFTDVFALPETADPGGPLAAPALRQPGVYYVSGSLSESNWGLGVENPAADLGGNTALQASESIPTIVGFSRLSRDWGYLRFSGIALELKSDTDSDLTGGVQVTGRLNTPVTGSEFNNLAFGAVYGAGFTHYYSSFLGGLAGIIADDGAVEATDIAGAYLGYQHFWTDRWRSTLTASFFDFDHPSGAAPDSFANSERYSMNLFYNPIDGVTFGLEGIYNDIETFDGSVGEGVRIEFVGRFDF